MSPDFDFYTEIMKQEQAQPAATVAKYNGKLVEVVDTWTTAQGAQLVTIELPDGSRRTVYASQVEVCRG
jgi:hypothetical protein